MLTKPERVSQSPSPSGTTSSTRRPTAAAAAATTEHHPEEDDHEEEDPHQPPSLRDYVREGWKDLELDLRMCKDDLQHGLFGDTTMKGAVLHQVYRGTGRAAKDTYRTVKHDLSEQFEEMKADFTVQKTLVKQDLKDFWQASREWTAKVAARRRRQEQEQAAAAAAAAEDDDCDDGTSPPRGHASPHDPEHEEDAQDQSMVHLKQAKIQEIREFEATLADPSFISELNVLIQSKLTSCPDLVTYYQDRPDLKEFTLTKELPRMKYTLYTHSGQKLTEPEEIMEYALAQESEEKHDILWRAANQSIFGDVISTVTCDTGLVRPHFNTASFVDDISVTLDLGRDTPHITAECFVNVTIPGYNGERLELAGALVGVYFCPVASKMEARVLHISPGRPLTDEQVEGAAVNLLSR